MLIENTSKFYLKTIRAKAKMYEYNVPPNIHIIVPDEVNDLILLCIGIIGDIANDIWDIKHAPVVLSLEKEKQLYFTSKFFDSYFHSKLSEEMNPYYILLGAVSYYFSNMNGSSKVMINLMEDFSDFEFNASGLEKVIIWLLNDNQTFDINDININYRDYISELIDFHNAFFTCNNTKTLDLEKFKKYIYSSGNNREILFVDIILAIFKKKIYNSFIYLMPKYSCIDREKWIQTFKNTKSIKEMWSSQILLGEKGIFRGVSGVIQMPTSSGKTTSIAFAVQAAFLSNRSSIIVIVAPFRALCKEILFDLEAFFSFDENIVVTEFSDIPESYEFDSANSDSITKKIFVMTPEKLAYILKFNPEIIENINTIVFDEAHLFDDKSRGTDYELLLSTINTYLKPTAQKILVSAVISNAAQLNAWINNENGVIVENNSIKVSEKTIAFNNFYSTNPSASFSNLHFIDINKNLEEEFFVPRVIQVTKLKKLNKERKERYFPSLKNNNQDVSIYFAIKLIKNGSIAIFCSKKDSANNFLKRFNDLQQRNIPLNNFISDKNECLKIATLIKEHLGENFLYTAALNGIVAHHAGIPNGIRISEEYALKNSLVRCVVCTSTLAQGVNLPIKYLIVSSIYQSKEIIKVRDFHNLIGRTARAGKETEGTIILTENINKNIKVYDNYKKLLDIKKSEECSSNLLKLVRDIHTKDNGIIPAKTLNEYISSKYSNPLEYIDLKNNILENKKSNSEIFYLMKEIEQILISLENFILNFSDNDNENFEVIESTYGYFLATPEERKELKNIYNLIKSNIDNLEINEKLLYKKSMLGIIKTKELSKYIIDNLEIIEDSDWDALILLIFNKLKESDDSKILPKLIDNENIPELLKMWLNGETYYKIWLYSNSKQLKIKRGKNENELSLENIILLCDSDFGYASLKIIQTIIEILISQDCAKHIQDELNDILFRIRYGLPNKESVYIYELGFSDRIISQKMANEIYYFNCSSKRKTKRIIRKRKVELKKILENYPSYFSDRLEKI